jgi:oligosaccharyltransferase complex subunit beta
MNVCFREWGLADVPSLGTETLLAFVEAGGNVVVVASEESTKSTWALSDFLEESGVQLASEGRMVIDHVGAADPAGDHTFVLADTFVDSPYVVGDAASKGAVVFKGVSQSFNSDNYLAMAVLSASATAYSANPNKAVPTSVTTGGDVVLVTAVQARNNARLVFFGSQWMLSNEAFGYSTGSGAAVSNKVSMCVCLLPAPTNAAVIGCWISPGVC